MPRQWVKIDKKATNPGESLGFTGKRDQLHDPRQQGTRGRRCRDGISACDPESGYLEEGESVERSRYCDHVGCRVRDDGTRTLLTVEQILSRGARARLRVVGELDFVTSEQLEIVLDDELSTAHQFVALDISAVTFCDGTGLDMLDRARTRFGTVGGELTLTGVPPQIARLMRLTSLLALLGSSTTQDDPPARLYDAPLRQPGRAHGHLHSV